MPQDTEDISPAQLLHREELVGDAVQDARGSASTHELLDGTSQGVNVYWLRTHNGSGCNLAMATDLIVDLRGTPQLVAVFSPVDDECSRTVIAEGDPQDMRDRRDEILDELIREQMRGQR